MSRIDVAIGVVIRAGRVLVCRRKDQGAFADLWEFPGGKCEAGETPRECLTRELAEELGIVVESTRTLAVREHDYPTIHVRLHPFLCTIVDGEPAPLQCQQVEWVAPPALRHRPFPAANGPLLDEVVMLLGPPR